MNFLEEIENVYANLKFQKTNSNASVGVVVARPVSVKVIKTKHRTQYNGVNRLQYV